MEMTAVCRPKVAIKSKAAHVSLDSGSFLTVMISLPPVLGVQTSKTLGGMAEMLVGSPGPRRVARVLAGIQLQYFSQDTKGFN